MREIINKKVLHLINRYVILLKEEKNMKEIEVKSIFNKRIIINTEAIVSFIF